VAGTRFVTMPLFIRWFVVAIRRKKDARVGHSGGSGTPGGSLRDGGWHPLEFTASVRNSGISLKS
jgi:hypothetical protein